MPSPFAPKLRTLWKVVVVLAAFSGCADRQPMATVKTKVKQNKAGYSRVVFMGNLGTLESKTRYFKEWFHKTGA
jgi:hypothetical protein